MRKPFPHKAEYRSDLIGLPLSEYQPTPVALCIEIGTYSSKVSVEQFIVTHIVWISRAWTFTLAIGKPRTNIVYFEKTAYPLFCSVTVYSICCSVIDVLDAKHWLKLPASQEASIRSIWFGHWLTKRLSAHDTICWTQTQKGRSQYKCVLWLYLTLNKLEPAPVTLHVDTITYYVQSLTTYRFAWANSL
jgi:hypothetical protein